MPPCAPSIRALPMRAQWRALGARHLTLVKLDPPPEWTIKPNTSKNLLEPGPQMEKIMGAILRTVIGHLFMEEVRKLGDRQAGPSDGGSSSSRVPRGIKRKAAVEDGPEPGTLATTRQKRAGGMDSSTGSAMLEHEHQEAMQQQQAKSVRL